LRIAAATLWLGCAGSAFGQDQIPDIDPLQIPDTQLEPIRWTEIDGWAADDHAAAFATFQDSCKPFTSRRGPARDNRLVAGALVPVCKLAAAAGALTAAKARAFFEENFRPVRIAKLGETQGLLTGYYEPIVDGSRFPNPEFAVPLYRRPRDLVIDGPMRAGASLPNRGKVGRRNTKNEIEPYHDRAAIEDGALDGLKLEIAWLKDPFDALTIQIQGSARVRLEDGTMLRVNYDAHNGYPYTAVGRVLIDRNAVPRDEMSMDRIRQWMRANPNEAQNVRQANRSFVFFRITGLSNEGEAVGAQGVPLTAGRSIAVDRTHVYGTPFFIEADLPIDSAKPTTKLRRLMVAQDTGSAIQGPARADLYWGAGDEAGRVAGRIRHQGRFVVLLPRQLDMVEAGRQMPLPTPKPEIAQVVAAKKPAAEAKGGADAAKAKTDTNADTKSDPADETFKKKTSEILPSSPKSRRRQAEPGGKTNAKVDAKTEAKTEAKPKSKPKS
jgi:membrane-bound lytic murein transglycosylase A